MSIQDHVHGILQSFPSANLNRCRHSQRTWHHNSMDISPSRTRTTPSTHCCQVRVWCPRRMAALNGGLVSKSPPLSAVPKSSPPGRSQHYQQFQAESRPAPESEDEAELPDGFSDEGPDKGTPTVSPICLFVVARSLSRDYAFRACYRATAGPLLSPVFVQVQAR